MGPSFNTRRDFIKKVGLGMSMGLAGATGCSVAAWSCGMPINQMRPESKARSEVHELVIAKLLGYGEQAVIDCTGDADIAYYAGAETMKEVGNLSPMTLCLNLTNITSEQLRKVQMRTVAEKARGKYPLIPRGWGLRKVSNATSFYINHAGTRDIGQFHATDPFQRSEAECASRRQVLQMVLAMREFGGEHLRDIELIGTGPQMGVRETQRVERYRRMSARRVEA